MLCAARGLCASGPNSNLYRKSLFARARNAPLHPVRVDLPETTKNRGVGTYYGDSRAEVVKPTYRAHSGGVRGRRGPIASHRSARVLSGTRWTWRGRWRRGSSTESSLTSLRTPKNPRRHSKAQIAQIASGIAAFGFNPPINSAHTGSTLTTLAMAGSPRYQNQIDWRQPIEWAAAQFPKQSPRAARLSRVSISSMVRNKWPKEAQRAWRGSLQGKR